MCLRVAYASGHLRGDISSSEPESSEPPSPLSRHVAAQLIYSPQPTNSQLLQILTQGTISALLGMPPSRTSSVGCSYRQYESDINLHEADDRRRTREARGSTLRGFASLENVLPNPAAPFPSHHFASSQPSPPAPSEAIPIVVVTVPDPAAPTGTAPAPRIDTSLRPGALLPFHQKHSSLWLYLRAPLDDRDDTVKLDFADTSALSDVDAFKRRRRNGKNVAKLSKKDRARERWEIERS